jgi:hypothetical protein
MPKSDKPVLRFSDCLEQFSCVLPKQAATEWHEGKPCLRLSINSDNFFIPCEEKAFLTYSQWSLLKDINFIYLPKGSTYDPIRGRT